LAEIVTRTVGPTAKGSPLTNVEVDNNFININDQLEEVAASVQPTAEEMAIVFAIALG
jgi:hypothetical protein